MTAPLTPAQEWWTADEIAAACLPDMPTSKRNVNATAERLDWRAQPGMARRRAGKGGGWEYNWALFPERARRKLLAACLPPSAKILPTAFAPPWLPAPTACVSAPTLRVRPRALPLAQGRSASD